MKTLAIGLLAAALLAFPPLAGAKRYEGSYSDAHAATNGSLRFRGKLKAGQLAGRVRCPKGCPVRGRLATTCSEVGSGTFSCEGTIAGGCTVGGYFYTDYFQGTYQCGSTVGAFSFGPARSSGGQGGGHGDGEGGSYRPPRR